MRAVWRHIGRIDDYQRLLLLRGLGGGFAVAMIAAITVGFLGIAGLPNSPPITGWVVYGAGMAGWIVSAAPAGEGGWATNSLESERFGPGTGAGAERPDTVGA